jgi:hypothetical protein
MRALELFKIFILLYLITKLFHKEIPLQECDYVTIYRAVETTASHARRVWIQFISKGEYLVTTQPNLT